MAVQRKSLFAAAGASIHLARQLSRTFRHETRAPRDFGLGQLGEVAEGFTASEIESVIVEAHSISGFDDDQAPTNQATAEVLTDFVRLSKTSTD